VQVETSSGSYPEREVKGVHHPVRASALDRSDLSCWAIGVSSIFQWHNTPKKLHENACSDCPSAESKQY
jgi:hypothetical protein